MIIVERGLLSVIAPPLVLSASGNSTSLGRVPECERRVLREAASTAVVRSARVDRLTDVRPVVDCPAQVVVKREDPTFPEPGSDRLRPVRTDLGGDLSRLSDRDLHRELRRAPCCVPAEHRTELGPERRVATRA